MSRAKRSREGNVLLEFALIASLLFMVLAFTMDFGRAVYSAQVIEQAADHIARETAVAPLPATTATDADGFRAAIDPVLKSNGIYSEDYLAMDISNAPVGTDLLTYLDSLYPPGVPTGNRLLIPLMIQMDATMSPNIPAGSRWLVYPGALVPSSTAPTGYTVRIPTVQYGAGGTETVSPQASWLHVVEIDPKAFQLNSPQRGMAMVRVNYPFQAAQISGRYRDPNNPEIGRASCR